ncbi:MAG: putative membrane protein [Planctomycetota bacterium]|jgi:uncharacterized membrane protein
MKSTSLIFLVFVFSIFLPCSLHSQVDVEPDLSQRIQKILIKKCGECHSSTVRKPKGAFGFVDDLARVKKEYSADTNLEDNDLWYYMVDAEEDEVMPPGKAKNGPMSKNQLALIKTWILAGSPIPQKAKKDNETKPTKPTESLIPAAEKSDPVDDFADEATPAAEESSIIAPFHPVLVHFPIALIMVAVLMEFLRYKQGENWRPPLKLMLALVLISSVLAGFAGFRAQDAEGYSDATVEWHQWSAIAATVLATIACFLLFSKKELSGRRIWLYRVALVASAVLFGLTGHEGGILVFGPDHFG